MQPISLQAQQAVLLSMSMQKPQQLAQTQQMNIAPSSGINTYKACTLEPGCQYPVFVSYVNDGPCHFSVQLKQTEDVLVQLMTDINKMPLRQFEDIPIPGTVCLARSRDDNTTCRAVVTNEVDTQFKVFFVDFGNYEVLPLECLYQIPFKYVLPKVMAIRFSLAGVDKATVTIDMRSAFKKFVDNRLLHMKVLPSPTRTALPKCELWDPETMTSALDVVIRAAKHSYPEPVILMRGFSQPVKVSYVYSCNRFYVQLVKKEQELTTLMEELQSLCVDSSFMELSSIKPGIPCCAQYSEDQMWYRSQVTEISENLVTVRYIDYGNEESVPIDQLKNIEGEILTVLKPQAIECCLNGYQKMEPDVVRDGLLEELLLENTFTMKVVDMCDKKALVELFDDSEYNVASLLLDKLAAAISQVSPVLVQAGNKLEHRKSYTQQREQNFKGDRSQNTGREHKPWEKPSDRNEKSWRQDSRDNQNFEKNTNDNDRSWRQNKDSSLNSRLDKYKQNDTYNSNDHNSNDANWNDNQANDEWNDDMEKNVTEEPWKPQEKEEWVTGSNDNSEGGSSWRNNDNRGDRKNRGGFNNDRGGRDGRERFDKGGRGGFNSDRGDRGGFNSDRGDRGDRGGFNSDRGDRGGFNSDRADRGGFNSDRGDRGFNSDRGDRGFNSDRGDRGFNSDRSYNNDRGDRGGFNSDRNDRGGSRSDRGGRGGRGGFNDRGNQRDGGYRQRDYKKDGSESGSEKSFQRGPRSNSRYDRGGRNPRDFDKARNLNFDDNNAGGDSWDSTPKAPSIDAVPISTTFQSYEVVGTEAKITVSWFHNPELFHCQLVDYQEEFKTMMEEIHDFYKDRKPELVMCGAPVVALFPEDNVLYRARVLEVVGIDYKVYYVDFGNVSIVSKTWPIDKKFMNLPAQAIACSLNGISPIGEDWADPDTYSGYFDKEYFVCNFIKTVDEKNFVNITYESESIADLLVRDGLALSAASAPTDGDIDINVLLGQQFRATIISVNDLNDFIVGLDCGKIITCTMHNLETATETFKDDLKGLLQQAVIIYVDNVLEDNKLEITLYDTEGNKHVLLNPDEGSYDTLDLPCPMLVLRSNITGYVPFGGESSVCIQPNEYLETINSLLDLLFETYDGKPNENTIIPETDSIYAVNSEDGNWYRGKVTDFDDEQAVVSFIDYGNSEKVAFSALRELEKEFLDIPILCVEVNISCDGAPFVDKEVMANIFYGESSWEGTVQLLGSSAPVTETQENYVESTEETVAYIVEKPQENISNQKLEDQPVHGELVEKEASAERESAIDEPVKGTLVYMSHIDSPSDFYLQFAKNKEDIDNLQTELQTLVEEMEILENPAPGALCAAPYSVDQQWYRAEVLDADEDITTVRFVDFGNTDVIDNNTTRVKTLPPKLLSLAIYATRCALKVGPIGEEWDALAMTAFENLTNVENLTAEILNQDEKCTYVELYVDSTDIRAALVKENLVKTIMEKTETRQTGFVSHLNSPSEFWIQLESCIDELEWIAEQLSSAETFPDVTDFTPGTLCAALFPDDQMWYRARILSDTVAGLELIFIDYGNSCVCTDLKQLPEDLVMTAPLAMKCSLQKNDGIPTWTPEAAAKFADISAEGQTIFTVKKISSGETSIVQLFLEDNDVTTMLLPSTEDGRIKELEALDNLTIEKETGAIVEKQSLEPMEGQELDEKSKEKLEELNEKGATVFQIEFVNENTIRLYHNGKDIRPFLGGFKSSSFDDPLHNQGSDEAQIQDQISVVAETEITECVENTLECSSIIPSQKEEIGTESQSGSTYNEINNLSLMQQSGGNIEDTKVENVPKSESNEKVEECSIADNVEDNTLTLCTDKLETATEKSEPYKEDSKDPVDVVEGDATEKSEVFTEDSKDPLDEVEDDANKKSEAFTEDSKDPLEAVEDDATEKSEAFTEDSKNNLDVVEDDAVEKSEVFTEDSKDPLDEVEDDANEKSEAFTEDSKGPLDVIEDGADEKSEAFTEDSKNNLDVVEDDAVEKSEVFTEDFKDSLVVLEGDADEKSEAFTEDSKDPLDVIEDGVNEKSEAFTDDSKGLLNVVEDDATEKSKAFTEDSKDSLDVVEDDETKKSDITYDTLVGQLATYTEKIKAETEEFLSKEDTKLGQEKKLSKTDESQDVSETSEMYGVSDTKQGRNDIKDGESQIEQLSEDYDMKKHQESETGLKNGEWQNEDASSDHISVKSDISDTKQNTIGLKEDESQILQKSTDSDSSKVQETETGLKKVETQNEDISCDQLSEKFDIIDTKQGTINLKDDESHIGQSPADFDISKPKETKTVLKNIETEHDDVSSNHCSEKSDTKQDKSDLKVYESQIEHIPTESDTSELLETETDVKNCESLNKSDSSHQVSEKSDISNSKEDSAVSKDDESQIEDRSSDQLAEQLETVPNSDKTKTEYVTSIEINEPSEMSVDDVIKEHVMTKSLVVVNNLGETLDSSENEFSDNQNEMVTGDFIDNKEDIVEKCSKVDEALEKSENLEDSKDSFNCATDVSGNSDQIENISSELSTVSDTTTKKVTTKTSESSKSLERRPLHLPKDLRSKSNEEAQKKDAQGAVKKTTPTKSNPKTVSPTKTTSPKNTSTKSPPKVENAKPSPTKPLRATSSSKVSPKKDSAAKNTVSPTK
ncbi:protein tudor-like isoform X2 [Diabrotica undecimpunctata]